MASGEIGLRVNMVLVLTKKSVLDWIKVRLITKYPKPLFTLTKTTSTKNYRLNPSVYGLLKC
jgi:hypothetical protein